MSPDRLRRTTLPPGGHRAAHLGTEPTWSRESTEPSNTGALPPPSRGLPAPRPPRRPGEPPYLPFPQCAAVSTQLLSTRTPAQWNERPLKRETCQGCEPRAHGAPEVSRSQAVAFGGTAASAAGDRRWRSEQAARGDGWVWGPSAAGGRSRGWGAGARAARTGEKVGRGGWGSCGDLMEVGEGKERERGRRRGSAGWRKGPQQDESGGVWTEGAGTRGAGRGR